MEREYDKVLDNPKSLKSMHTEVRRLLRLASFHLDNKEFDRVESLYIGIECLMSSLGVSARILQEMQKGEAS